MSQIQLAAEYARELQSESASTRKCLERIPMNLSDWKPHEKSMAFGMLAILVAEIPKWIADIISPGEIDFVTYQHYQPSTTAELVKFYDDNLAAALKALEGVTNESLENEKFLLKANGQLLASSSKKESISSTINHGVHHRGQLTVYMRLNDIAVPSIYGPSADDRTFATS